MRIRLHTGVWSNGTGIALTGGGAVTAATATQTALQYLGYVGMALGFGLLVWGVTIDGEHWWRILPWFRKKPPHPQLYLSLTPDRRPDRAKGYAVCWSPENFDLRFSNYVPWGGELTPERPIEFAFVLFLFNAGPEDARHISVAWEIPGLDINAAVQNTGLFGDFVKELSPEHIVFEAPTRGASRPLRKKQEEKTPLLKAGEVMRIESPEAFTGAFAIACLAMAKTLIDRPKETPRGGDFAATMAFMRKLERRMPAIKVTISYTVGEGLPITQRFEVAGIVRAGSMLRQVGAPSEKTWEGDPDGLTASLDYLMVLDL